jgi:hypothetical protein
MVYVQKSFVNDKRIIAQIKYIIRNSRKDKSRKRRLTGLFIIHRLTADRDPQWLGHSVALHSHAKTS